MRDLLLCINSLLATIYHNQFSMSSNLNRSNSGSSYILLLHLSVSSLTYRWYCSVGTRLTTQRGPWSLPFWRGNAPRESPPCMQLAKFSYASTDSNPKWYVLQFVSLSNTWPLARRRDRWDVRNTACRVWNTTGPLMNITITGKSNKILSVASNIQHLQSNNFPNCKKVNGSWIVTFSD